MKKLKMKTWQWIFLGALVVLTIASIVAEFSMHEDHGTPPEPGELQEAHQPEQKIEHEEVAAAPEQEQEHQGSHWQSGIPLFWIGFGFIGCLALIVLAKNLLAPFIYKKEDYYNE
jgi:hypothetical protein